MTNLIDLSKLNVQIEKKVNKREISEQIFVEKYKVIPRKDIICLFMLNANLTFAGASTYYQNFVTKYKKLIEQEMNK